jgi:hypothetical protein
VDPTELFYDKPAPFHDTVNPRTSFDVIGLGAWYSHDDHELISMVQLQPTSSVNNQPCLDAGLYYREAGLYYREAGLRVDWDGTQQRPAEAGSDQRQPTTTTRARL